MTTDALFRDALDRLGRNEDLGEELAAEVMGAVMEGEASPARIGALLMGLRAKGETVDEIVGCARAIRSRAAAFPTAHDGLIDTCGTGGDGVGTFNISTTAAFVAAGAGALVAKHGNRAISSRAGSADVLGALGVEVGMPGPEAAAALDAASVTFLFAPTFHAAMRHAAPVRRDLGVRTVFNILGPLCNPAGAESQLVGVFDAALVRPIAEALGRLGARRAMVVHGFDGLDELTVTAPSQVAEWDGERVREYTVEPEALGFEVRPPESLRGGDAAENAEILKAALGAGGDAVDAGRRSAARDVAALNAGAALVVAGLADTLEAGVAQAREAIESGAAAARLDALVSYSAELRERPGRRKVVEPAVPEMSAGWGR